MQQLRPVRDCQVHVEHRLMVASFLNHLPRLLAVPRQIDGVVFGIETNVQKRS